MKRLLSGWSARPQRGSSDRQVLRLETRSESRWEPLPDDVAEWMGMNPYVAPAEQAAAS